MSENRKTNFIRQGTILAMASIIVRMIGIVYRIPVANIIGDEGNGIYGAAYEIYNLALILSSYSLPLAVSKLLSAQLAKGCYRTGKKIFTAALIFSCISGGLMALLIFFGAAFIETHFYSNFTGIAIPLKVLAITIFVVALLGTLRGFFQARRTMIPTAISQVLEQLVGKHILCMVIHTRTCGFRNIRRLGCCRFHNGNPARCRHRPFLSCICIYYISSYCKKTASPRPQYRRYRLF